MRRRRLAQALVLAGAFWVGGGGAHNGTAFNFGFGYADHGNGGYGYAPPVVMPAPVVVAPYPVYQTPAYICYPTVVPNGYDYNLYGPVAPRCIPTYPTWR